MTGDACARLPSMAEILAATSVYYRIDPDDLVGGDKSQYSAGPRQVACYLARRMTTKSYPEIARDVGLEDHTTVMHAVKRVAEDSVRRRGTTEAVTAIGGLVDHIRALSWRPMSFGAARRECEDWLYAVACAGRCKR
jgi:hypothetical protein